MTARFENIVDLAAGFVHGKLTSASLEQHCSAMRMDKRHAHTSNAIGYALVDARADLKRLDKAGIK